MSDAASHSPAQPFFMDAGHGKRFCLYYAPSDAAPRGAILYIPPFAEEMNRSRRMAALQARAFSAQGYAVLQMDLFGCGDSAGDFGQARWEIWIEDLLHASEWLQEQAAAPMSLWALRLGGLLALDFARHAKSDFQHLMLWQPVLDAESFVTQFLRLRLAADMLGGKEQPAPTVKQLRAQLAAGETVEVAGYALSAKLVSAIENADATAAGVQAQAIHCFEVVAESAEPVSPARSRQLQSLAAAGCQPMVRPVHGQPFWSAQEPEDCPQLIAATLDAIQKDASHGL